MSRNFEIFSFLALLIRYNKLFLITWWLRGNIYLVIYRAQYPVTVGLHSGEDPGQTWAAPGGAEADQADHRHPVARVQTEQGGAVRERLDI